MLYNEFIDRSCRFQSLMWFDSTGVSELAVLFLVFKYFTTTGIDKKALAESVTGSCTLSLK